MSVYHYHITTHPSRLRPYTELGSFHRPRRWLEEFTFKGKRFLALENLVIVRTADIQETSTEFASCS